MNTTTNTTINTDKNLIVKRSEIKDRICSRGPTKQGCYSSVPGCTNSKSFRKGRWLSRYTKESKMKDRKRSIKGGIGDLPITNYAK
jgi:hypothetical protein